jgi:hypothetical protein
MNLPRGMIEQTGDEEKRLAANFADACPEWREKHH